MQVRGGAVGVCSYDLSRRTRRADDHPRHHHHPFRSMDRLHHSEQAVRYIGIVKGRVARTPLRVILLDEAVAAGNATPRTLGMGAHPPQRLALPESHRGDDASTGPEADVPTGRPNRSGRPRTGTGGSGLGAEQRLHSLRAGTHS